MKGDHIFLFINEFIMNSSSAKRLQEYLDNKTVEEFYRDLNNNNETNKFVREYLCRRIGTSVSIQESIELFTLLNDINNENKRKDESKKDRMG